MARPNERTIGVAVMAAVAVTAVAVAVGMQPDPVPAPTCTKLPTPLQVTVSTEKAAGPGTAAKAVDTIAEEYNRARRPIAAGGQSWCAAVQISALTSGTAETALAGGWTDPAYTQGLPRPEVWLPSSSVWPALLRKAKPGAAPRATTFPSLAQSPLVLALPLSKAEALRRRLPGAGFDWTLLQSMVDPRNVPLSWGSGILGAGRREWGQFHLRKDDPVGSTSGLAAVVAAYLDLTGKNGWKPEDPDLKKALRRTEGLVSNGGYTPDGTEMMRTLAAFDQAQPGWGSDTSAVIVQEALLYQYDTATLGGTAVTAQPRERLVPLYPLRTKLTMDHPYVELPSLDTAPAERRLVAQDFLAFLRTDPFARDAFSHAGLRAPDGRNLPGLTELDGTLRRDRTAAGHDDRVIVPDKVDTPAWPSVGTVITAQNLWKETRKRAHMLLLIDESETMNDDGRMEAVRRTLRQAVKDWLNQSDEVALWGFSAKEESDGGNRSDPVITPLQDWTTGGLPAIDAAIGKLTPKTDTPLFEAIRLAREEVAKQPTRDQQGEWANVVVVLTDGEDDYFGDSVTTAWAGTNKIPVYAIAYGPKAADATKDLTRIAGETLGDFEDATDPAALDEAFAKALRVA